MPRDEIKGGADTKRKAGSVRIVVNVGSDHLLLRRSDGKKNKASFGGCDEVRRNLPRARIVAKAHGRGVMKNAHVWKALPQIIHQGIASADHRDSVARLDHFSEETGRQVASGYKRKADTMQASEKLQNPAVAK